MLNLNNIEVTYLNVILAVKAVSFEVPDMKIVSLFGTNGAGKTTTLKAISGLLSTEEGRVTRGNIQFDNERIDNRVPEDIVNRGIIQVMEGRRLFEHLTAEENLKAGGYAIRNGHDIERFGHGLWLFPKA